MILTILGIIIGALITAFGLYYYFKEKSDAESAKIYGIASVAGAVIFVASTAKLIISLL